MQLSWPLLLRRKPLDGDKRGGRCGQLGKHVVIISFVFFLNDKNMQWDMFLRCDSCCSLYVSQIKIVTVFFSPLQDIWVMLWLVSPRRFFPSWVTLLRTHSSLPFYPFIKKAFCSNPTFIYQLCKGLHFTHYNSIHSASWMKQIPPSGHLIVHCLASRKTILIRVEISEWLYCSNVWDF